jgi:hypothetical protein
MSGSLVSKLRWRTAGSHAVEFGLTEIQSIRTKSVTSKGKADKIVDAYMMMSLGNETSEMSFLNGEDLNTT